MSKQRRDSKQRNEFIEKLKSDPSFYPSYRDRLPDLLLSTYPEGIQTPEIQAKASEIIEGGTEE